MIRYFCHEGQAEHHLDFISAYFFYAFGKQQLGEAYKCFADGESVISVQ
jgi:hypothetical protein